MATPQEHIESIKLQAFQLGQKLSQLTDHQQDAFEAELVRMDFDLVDLLTMADDIISGELVVQEDGSVKFSEEA